MFEIITGLIDLISLAINELFNINITLYDNVSCSLGLLIIAFIFIIVTLYLLFNTVFGGEE